MSQATPSAPIPATLIPGDGIGPEITEATLAILEAVGRAVRVGPQLGGMAGIAAAGDPLPRPRSTASAARASR